MCLAANSSKQASQTCNNSSIEHYTTKQQQQPQQQQQQVPPPTSVGNSSSRVIHNSSSSTLNPAFVATSRSSSAGGGGGGGGGVSLGQPFTGSGAGGFASLLQEQQKQVLVTGGGRGESTSSFGTATAAAGGGPHLLHTSSSLSRGALSPSPTLGMEQDMTVVMGQQFSAAVTNAACACVPVLPYILQPGSTEGATLVLEPVAPLYSMSLGCGDRVSGSSGSSGSFSSGAGLGGAGAAGYMPLEGEVEGEAVMEGGGRGQRGRRMGTGFDRRFDRGRLRVWSIIAKQGDGKLGRGVYQPGQQQQQQQGEASNAAVAGAFTYGGAATASGAVPVGGGRGGGRGAVTGGTGGTRGGVRGVTAGHGRQVSQEQLGGQLTGQQLVRARPASSLACALREVGQQQEQLEAAWRSMGGNGSSGRGQGEAVSGDVGGGEVVAERQQMGKMRATLDR